VRLTDQFVQVIVTEGRVEVAPLQRDTALEESASSSVPSFRHELVVGQMTELPLSSDLFLDEPVINPMVKEVSLSEMNQFLAWKPQMFEFDSTPLSEVIEELNRRNKTHIVIADANLRGMPIVASFRSADVEHFLELLQLSMDLEIKRDGKERIVLHSSH
jgi:transmembrane sensor